MNCGHGFGRRRPLDDVVTLGMSVRVVLTVLFGALPAALFAAPPAMLELRLEGAKRVGAILAHNDVGAWFLERDGRLSQIEIAKVTDFHPLGRFRPFSSVELREKLARDFGSDYTVATTGQYVVVGPPKTVDRLAPLFENLYRQFLVTFAARGFKVQPPETPLIAVVLPDEETFERYCMDDGVRPQRGLRGYYLPSSNRVALYDATQSGQATPSGLDATVLHEATHQVAYNVGVHSRMGVNPKWVVEGLATVFEREAMRTNDRRGPALSRVNPERFAHFQKYRKERRPAKSLGDFVQNDRSFETAVLDAYSQSWALTFFLMETRSTEYAAYLRKLSQRDPLADYLDEERLRDFQTAFGRDMPMLEAHFLQFFQELSGTKTTATEAPTQR